MVLTLDETRENRAKIKVVGVGGAGGNALNRMIESGLTGVEFIAINTDSMALENNLAEKKISIGQKLCKGLGAGSRPDKGFDAIQEDRKAVEAALSGADMVFIAGGMGGGTGTGAAPVVAEISRELGILTVGVVTEPFDWEGPVRKRHSKRGLANLTTNVDTIISIKNQRIFDIIPKNTTVLDAYKTVDGVLMDAVRGISDIILNHGFMQVDFADVREIMTNGGDALIGTGIAEGEGKARLAAELAIHSPLLDDISISGAGGLLVNITGGDQLAMHEINEVMTYIYDCVGEENEPHIIFGNVIDSALGDKVVVTVIATGFARNKAETPVEVKPAAVEVKPVAAPKIVVEPVVYAAEEKLSVEMPKTAAPIVQQTQQMQSAPITNRPVQLSIMDEIHSMNAPAAPDIDEEIFTKNDSFYQEIKRIVDDEPLFKSEPMDVRSLESEETVFTKSQDLSSFYRDIHEAEQTTTQLHRPTQRMQELTSSFVDEGIDYSKPAFQRNGGFSADEVLRDSKLHSAARQYDCEASEIDETPAFLRMHE